MVVFLVSSTSCPLTPLLLPPLILSSFQKKNEQKSASKNFQNGREGGVKSFQHINEQQAPTALSQRSLFLCQICTREAFPTILHYLAQNLFSTPILLFHMQQNTHKRITEFERRFGINLEGCGREGHRPGPLKEISTFRIPAGVAWTNPMHQEVISILPE